MAKDKSLFITATALIADLEGDVIKQRTAKGKTALKCDKCGQSLDEVEEKELTVGLAVVNALNGIFDNSAKLSADEKLDRFKLAAKIHGSHLPVEIDNKEKTMILKLVAEAYASPIVVARVNENIREGAGNE